MDVIAEALLRREERYCRTQERRVQTVDEARAFVERVGFCFLWPIKGIEMPSLFHAIAGQGAYINQQKLDLSSSAGVDKITAATIDFKRLPTELACKIVSNPPYKSQRSFGSVALDWCWFSAERGDVYLHGRQNLWDYAAGLLILQEAGGVCSTLDGEPVFNGSLETRSALIGINQTVYDQWFGFLHR